MRRCALNERQQASSSHRALTVLQEPQWYDTLQGASALTTHRVLLCQTRARATYYTHQPWPKGKGNRCNCRPLFRCQHGAVLQSSQLTQGKSPGNRPHSKSPATTNRLQLTCLIPNT